MCGFGGGGEKGWKGWKRGGSWGMRVCGCFEEGTGGVGLVNVGVRDCVGAGVGGCGFASGAQASGFGDPRSAI